MRVEAHRNTQSRNWWIMTTILMLFVAGCLEAAVLSAASSQSSQSEQPDVTQPAGLGTVTATSTGVSPWCLTKSETVTIGHVE